MLPEWTTFNLDRGSPDDKKKQQRQSSSGVRWVPAGRVREPVCPAPGVPGGNVSILEISNLSLSFGGVKALQDVSFHVPENTVTTIIGPNGAGKTSLFNCISGFYKPQQGTIR